MRPLALLALGLALPGIARAQCSQTSADGKVITIITDPVKCPSKIPPPDNTPPVAPNLTIGVDPTDLTKLPNFPPGKSDVKQLPATTDPVLPDGQTPGAPKTPGNGSANLFNGTTGGNATGVSGAAGAANTAARQQSPSTSSGYQLLQAKQPIQADRNFQNALAANPRDTTALAGHVEALMAQGKRDEAVQAARGLLALDPNNQVAQATIASAPKLDNASGVTKKFQKLAEAVFRGPEPEAMPQTAGAAAAWTGGGAPAQAAGPAAKPGADLPAIAARATSSFGVFAPLTLAAQEKLNVGDFTGALVDLSQQLDANPNDTAALTLRADVDNHLENWPAAITDATRALALLPTDARALRARAYAELESALNKQALADAARAVELDPRNGLGFLYKAMAEDKLGQGDAAARDVQQAVALDPTLRRLAAPLLRKFHLPDEAEPASGLKPWMVRGGLVGLSMLLILLGLLGSKAGRALTTGVKLTPRRRQTDAPVPVELGPGRVLSGNYRVVRELGRGGMGVVYEGFDQALQRRVAIKRLLRDEQTTLEDDERFLREARLVAQLKHPNIAEIYALLEEAEPLLVFEHVDGKPLDGMLSGGRALPLADVRRMVGEVASALAYAHGRGIIHRDLKPSNIMIGADGAAKVMDFGIAHQTRATATKLTRTFAVGTPPYMAPEQAMGSVSKASDLYALGVMAYELLTGKRPFPGPDFMEQKLQRRFASLTSLDQRLPPGLDAFFAKALDPDPLKRPAGAEAFATEFNRACDATPRRQASSV